MEQVLKIKYNSLIEDYAVIITEAIANAKENATIEFEKGVYPIRGVNVSQSRYYLSNNDVCDKPIAFHLKRKKGLKINGNGATLLFEDYISGFGIVDCDGVEICNLTIDYAGNYHLELEVAEIHRDIARINKRDGFDFRLIDGEIFAQQGKVGKCLCSQFDAEHKSPCYRDGFFFVDFSKEEREKRYIVAEMYEKDGFYYLRSNLTARLQVGSVLVLSYVRKRFHQAIFALDSKDIYLHNVQVAYSPSMAFVAQGCENIRLQKLCVEPNGKHGMISSICDATHFVHCSGKVFMDDCRYFNMMDDAVNVHGNYAAISHVEKDCITLEIMHEQQQGVRLFNVGDEIIIYKQKTADLRCITKVLESTFIDEKYLVLRLQEVGEICEGDIVYNQEKMPEVEIRNTSCGNNRPRGFLLNSPKKILVDGCHFSNSEHGIELSGDEEYWYEAGMCNDVTITRCVFENCNHANGDYPICIHPVFDINGENKYYHKNVSICGNTFIGFQSGMVSARNVENIMIADNVFKRDKTYPPRTLKNGKIRLRDCLVKSVKHNIDLEEILPLLSPIWQGNRVLEQTAIFVGEQDVAPWLYPMQGDIEVTDFFKTVKYTEGKDFIVTEQGLKRLDGAMPFYAEDEFYRRTPDVINIGVNPEKLSFPDAEKRYFKFGGLQHKTVRISYTCKEKTDVFSLNEKQGCCLGFRKKLQAKEDATVVFYGDSITEGANASAELRVSPYQEMWPILSFEFLKYFYKNERLRYVNTAVGGKDSIWGLENFEERVIAHSPDLLVLAFGMNDGGKSPEEYEALIDQMLQKLSQQCPKTEVILVATSVPNPESRWYGNQHKFLQPLQFLAEKYDVGLMDMTTVTEILYGEKGLIRYRDFSGNNVNHPNDFGVRLYAQVFLNELLGEDYRAFFRE